MDSAISSAADIFVCLLAGTNVFWHCTVWRYENLLLKIQ